MRLGGGGAGGRVGVVTVTLARRADISLDAFDRVAWEGEDVAIAAEALEVVARRREDFLALVAADPTRKLYGVNVHAGDGSDRLMTEAEQRDYARGLHSATSFGDPLPRRVVRGIVLARLANLVEGHAGVTPELVCLVAGRLDGRDLPPVPRLGNGGLRARSSRSAGCSAMCRMSWSSGSRRAWP